MKKLRVVVLIVISVVLYAMWCARPNNGIHSIPGNKNVVLIEGSCITINWDASEAEWNEAKDEWVRLRS